MLIIEKDGKVTMQCKAARNEKGGGKVHGLEEIIGRIFGVEGMLAEEIWEGEVGGGRRGKEEERRANGLTETQI